MEDLPDIIQFFGRFHPLVVHLPIGFLLLAIIMEFAIRFPRFAHLRSSLGFIWLSGASSGVVALAFGYLLSLGGGYSENTLLWHQWSGILLTLLSFLCYTGRSNSSKLQNLLKSQVRKVLVFTTLCLLILTGHYGGNLTHGSDYLTQYAPQPVRQIMGLPEKTQERPEVTGLDVADIFKDAIQPMMEARCTSCHNPDKIKGDLLLTSFEGMLRGGKNGAAVVPGKPEDSELYKRITLPENHDDFMPAEGKTPLTSEEIAIVKWWIEQDAPSTGFIADRHPDTEMTQVFEQFFGLGAQPLQIPGAAAPDTAVINALIREGFILNELAEHSNLLEANLSLSQSGVADLSLLTGIKDQLLWLQLFRCRVSDKDLESIGQLTRLRKLNLSETQISDAGLKHLEGLTELEYLNLHNTPVTEASLPLFKSLPSLKSLYVWQTAIPAVTIEALKSELPEVTIVYEAPSL